MPPMTKNTAATRPEMPTTHWIRLVTRVLASISAFGVSEPFWPRKAMRMELRMMLADRTMARPMKAWIRDLLPAAALPGWRCF